jgi:hypothetical protein
MILFQRRSEPAVPLTVQDRLAIDITANKPCCISKEAWSTSLGGDFDFSLLCWLITPKLPNIQRNNIKSDGSNGIGRKR